MEEIVAARPMGRHGTILITFASPSQQEESFTGVFVAQSVNTSSVLWFVFDAIAQGTNRQPAPQVLPCVESVVSSMAKRRMIVPTIGRSTACVVITSVTSLSILSVRESELPKKIQEMGNIQHSYLLQWPVKVPTSGMAKPFQNELSQLNSSEILHGYSSHRRKCGIKRRSACDLRQRMHGPGAAMQRFAA
ncbi:hypothetical protein HPB48_015717 [Haemaphysalis longicornis]|uniref:Uncharacterized protein n=1 Tax=Haemaphysalis longicornis TaxID=44386 RepID=A0A9J6F6K3_HAELO|nr:hypothetical protein HPB48_015717 [Haemaphysalis longicornis]